MDRENNFLTLKSFIIKTGFILLISICCFCKVSLAQTDLSNFSINHLTTDDGLSQGSNYFRFEDSRGYMWITGNDAVNRYDGSMVKVYNLDKYYKNCPNLQQGYGFAEDDKSNIYIGSVRGLYIYNRNTDKFTLQKIFTDTVNEEAMPFVYKEGKVWCFNKKYEIATYHIADYKVEYISNIPIAPLPAIHIYGLEGNAFYYRWPFFDANNNIWFVGTHETFKMNAYTKEIKKVAIGATLKSEPTFLCTYYDSLNNEIYFGTNDGLLIYNVTTAKEKHITHIGGIPVADVQSVCSNKNLIAITNRNGLLLSDKQFDKHLWLGGTDKKFIRLYSLDFDKAGRLWMCDDGIGQYIYNFSLPLLPKLPGENIAFSKLNGNGVSTFAEFANGDIIVQYNFLLNNKTRQLENINYPKDFDIYIGFRTETDKQRKGVWLLRLTYVKQELKIYFTSENKIPVLQFTIKESENLGALQQIKPLDDGRLLAAFSSGLCWLNNNSVAKIDNQPSKNPFVINQLSNNRCAVSYLNNDMWLIQLINSNEIKFIRRILPGVQSFYMQEDTIRNQYWVGTNKGIYLLDKSFKQLKLFDANNGLAGTHIYGILLDDVGNAWCSHQRGLSSINAATYQITNYDKSDGIQDWDFNNRAFYKAADGTLYFGGVRGFNYFKPPVQRSTYYQPEVYIDEIWVNNKTYWPDTNANLIHKLNLSFTENNISIKAIIKDLANANSRQLIYRIKETDAKWKYLSNNSTLSFNSLSPGNYTLELGIYDKYTNKEIMQKTLSISIAAPFYRKAWFWVLISILTTAFLFRIYNRRKINKQQTALRQQLALEQQRNKITADLHDDIGSSLSSLQVNSAVANQLIDKDTKQAKQVLDKIETQSKDLADKIGDIIWSMKPGKDEFMTMSSRIKNFANDMLGSTNLEYEVKIDAAADTDIKDITARKNIVLITKEAINNAVKYSNASHISIQLKKDLSAGAEKGQFVLNITDNGIGLITNGTTGNGIANMKKRATEINAILSIDTAPGKGTSIVVLIPVS